MKDQKIGLIGLGSMGSEMDLKFLAAGYDLTVYDIKPERLSPIISAGATEARSAANLIAICYGDPNPGNFILLLYFNLAILSS